MSYYVKHAAVRNDREEDVQMIQDWQQNKNKLAAKKLKQKYSQIIDIVAANNSGIVPTSTMKQYLHSEFARSLSSYDPTHTSGAAPRTYFETNLKRAAQTYANELRNETRMAAADTDKSSHINNAVNLLSVSGNSNPTDEDISKALINDLKVTRVSPSDIARIKSKKRKTLSGDMEIGESGVGENITLMDTVNTFDKTPEEIMQEEETRSKIDMALNKIDPNDKKLYEHYRGIGEFKGMKLKTPELVQTYNLGSPHKARKKIEDIQAQLRKNMIGED